MHNRLRFLQGAAALLYFGPLLAGLGGFGWSVVPAFVAIFLMWLFILRPHQWPRNLSDWKKPEALVFLVTQLAVQTLLVTICFGVGRGIGGVFGALPGFPLMLPVGISFLSIPLGRLLWDPWRAAEADRFLDEALAELNGAVAEPEQDALDRQRERAELAGRLVEELDRLPENSSDETLAAHLFAMASQVEHEALRVALMDKVYDGTASPLHRRAVIVHATDSRVVDHLAGTIYPLSVFNELSHPAELQLFAVRCEAMVRQTPGTAAECPDAAAVTDAATSHPRAAAALSTLAQLLAQRQAVAAKPDD